MKKWILHLKIILIGLSLISCDPEETFYNEFYQRTFQNDTGTEIKIIYNNSKLGDSDSLILRPHSKMSSHFKQGISSEGVKEDNFELIIKTNIDIFYDNINKYGELKLYAKGELIKDWTGPSGYFGNNINSPFNYNSWEIIKYNQIIKDGYDLKYGEIIFSITNEDIE